MNVELYDEFFREHYSFIRAVVYKSGIPLQEVGDVASDILLKVIEQDGMGKFEPERQKNIRAYIAVYVSRCCTQGYRQRQQRYHFRYELVDTPEDQPFTDHQEYIDSSIYDELVGQLDGDALTFLNHAFESQNYTEARKCLSDKGWEKKRITAAVKHVRKVANLCLSN